MKQPVANTTMGDEDELLICCARVSQSAEIRARMEQLLHRSIDWQTVLDRSWWHRIRPLTHMHLCDHPGDVVPPAVLTALGEQTDELRCRNERLMATLGQVSQLFEEASLRMLVFKGPTLALDAYGDLQLRECGDLDLLIHPADFLRAKEVLIEDGFSCLWDSVDSGRKRQRFACEFRRGGVELDVHWDLAPKWHNYVVDFDRFWQDGTGLQESIQYVRKLRPEDSLEVLCMHGTRHWWDRIRWICDIAELVNSGKISDWDRAERQSVQSRCHRSVWLGLWLAKNLLDARLPAEIQQRLEGCRVVNQLANQVGVWLDSGDRAAEVRRLPDRFLFRMRLCETWADLFPQLARYLMTLPSRSVTWNS